MWTNDSDDTLYVNRDRSKVVAEDSPDVAFVLVGPGGQIEDEEAARLGLNKAKAVDGPEPEVKAVDGPAENKAHPTPKVEKK